MTIGFTTSPELAAIVRRYLQAYGENDAATMLNLFLNVPEARYIGTDEDEDWDGPTFHAILPGYVETKPEYEILDLDVDAFDNGAFGYALVRLRAAFATGQEARARCTYVFTMDRGAWRILHGHQSSAIPNIDNMGFEAQGVEDLLQAAAEAQVDLGQTGMASIMFTDIADSTTIAEALGDTRWAAAVRHHLDQMRGLIETGGGHLVKSLGDGTMSTFPSAQNALATARTIQKAMAANETEPRLSVRIGLHTGDLVGAGDDFFGSVVNKAARVAALAGPDEIRLSDATRVMVGSNPMFSFFDPVSAALKGFEGEHVIYQLEWQA